MKWICPVCKKENQKMICGECGFDEGKNYACYGVITKLKEKQRKDYEEIEQNYQKKKEKVYQLQNPRIVKNSSMVTGQKVTWDCVWFGSYPQSEVREDSEVYAKLVNAVEWDRNDDIVIDETKYRRVKREGKKQYFQYEPIKWRVLKVENGKAFLLADIILDIQRYHGERKAITWEKSIIRSWLNHHFLNLSFSFLEQEAIEESLVVNEDNLHYGTKGGNKTKDKLFLLSESEICATKEAESYGFESEALEYDKARKSKYSKYVYAILNTKKIGDYRSWWLRSPGYDTYSATIVLNDGYVYGYGNYVDFYSNGVRPALNLNLSSSHLYSYAGTVCSGVTIDEVALKQKEKNNPDFSVLESGLTYTINGESQMITWQELYELLIQQKRK